MAACGINAQKYSITINNPTSGDELVWERNENGEYKLDDSGNKIPKLDKKGKQIVAVHDWTHEKINLYMEKKGFNYWCLSDEIGEKGTFHTHIFGFKKGCIRKSTLINGFKIAHVENVIRPCSINRAYIFKEGIYNRDENGFYKYIKNGKEKSGKNLIDTHEEYGEMPKEVKSGTRSDLKKIKELIEAGKSNLEIKQEVHSAFLYGKMINDYRNELYEQKYGKTEREMEVIWIDGDSNLGKTTWVEREYGENVYKGDCTVLTGNQPHPMDSYGYEPVVLLDEFDSSLPINTMKNLMQGKRFRMDCRNYPRLMCYTKLYIASNTYLYNQYPNLREQKSPHIKAFERRIHKVMYFYDFCEYITFESDFTETNRIIKLAADKYKEAVDTGEINKMIEFSRQLKKKNMDWEVYRNIVNNLKCEAYLFVTNNIELYKQELLSISILPDWFADGSKNNFKKEVMNHIFKLQIGDYDITNIGGYVFAEIEKYIADILMYFNQKISEELDLLEKDFEDENTRELERIKKTYNI